LRAQEEELARELWLWSDDTTPATGWDDSVTHEDISIDPSPRTIDCKIVIDP
jgi:hypothetical protein